MRQEFERLCKFRHVTKQADVEDFVLCVNSYSNIESVIINCSYDLWISNKSIHHSKSRVQVTDTHDNTLLQPLVWSCNVQIVHPKPCLQHWQLLYQRVWMRNLEESPVSWRGNFCSVVMQPRWQADHITHHVLQLVWVERNLLQQLYIRIHKDCFNSTLACIIRTCDLWLTWHMRGLSSLFAYHWNFAELPTYPDYTASYTDGLFVEGSTFCSTVYEDQHFCYFHVF
jgi:hypothetical protein